ncbi:MAG: hypothetical protein OXI24_00065, partial [Candidatus Poribacteria bacterium]|nr:hypothetical protein [Candidatus Poribacteria bacterium]
MRRFLCLAGFLLSLSWVVSAQPPIEVIYLNPSDVASPTEADINSLREVMVAVQTFFASEMERYGFGPKTFDFNPDIKVIMGREKAAAYDNVAVIRNEVHRLDYSVPNKIDVVFLAGKKDILNKRASGVMNALCWRQPGEDSEDCNYLGVIALENPFYFLPVVAHEIAHAFKIDHSPDTLPGRVNLMNAPHTVQIGVREDLSKYGIRREDAAFLNEDGRLSIQQSTLTTSDDQNYIQLTFSVERGDAIKPINR